MDSDEALVIEGIDDLLTNNDPSSTSPEKFWGAQYDLGLAWVRFPKGLGGLGVSPKFQDLITNRVREAGGPLYNFALNPMGLGMAGPTIVAHGSASQQQRYLRPMFACEEIWCQLFSEPGAGSDVASLSTRAERDGDEWVVDGQKVWTSLAHVSRWGLLLARTAPDLPKHKGMTYFVVDMHGPGVEVRPLRQMTGQAEFNEVYFTAARIPDSERLGGVGEGWNVALTTLMNERVTISGGAQPRGSGTIAEAMRIWRECRDPNPVLRDQLMQFWIKAETIRLTNARAAASRKVGTPGPEGSIGKLAVSEFNKEIFEFCVTLMGAEGTLYGSYEMEQPHPTGSSDICKAFLRGRAHTIEGGTSQIMRNILAERVLGLPGDVRVDKELPWSQVPRN